MGGPTELGPRSRRPLPRMRRPHARKESCRVGLAGRVPPEGPGSQNRRLDRGAAERRAVRGPQPRARRTVHACQAAAQGPPPPRPGAGRREAARAQAGAVAVLTHGGDGGGGGYSPEVSPPQPGLHAGGAGGGDGSGPGSARGPWAALAALGAPAASPGSGSGRALWHEQGGPLHPRRSQARPSPASAAPLGRPACQSSSPEVAPTGRCSPPQERSEKQTAGRAASLAVCHSCQHLPIACSRWALALPPLSLPANNQEEARYSRPSSPLSPNALALIRQLITTDQSRLLSQDANGRSQGDFRGRSRACQSPRQCPPSRAWPITERALSTRRGASLASALGLSGQGVGCSNHGSGLRLRPQPSAKLRNPRRARGLAPFPSAATLAWRLVKASSVEALRKRQPSALWLSVVGDLEVLRCPAPDGAKCSGAGWAGKIWLGAPRPPELCDPRVAHG